MQGSAQIIPDYSATGKRKMVHDYSIPEKKRCRAVCASTRLTEESCSLTVDDVQEEYSRDTFSAPYQATPNENNTH